MGILSTGFVTLVDLTDQRPVQFYLEINGSRVQSKGGDGTYQPDFTKTPINIEPKLFFGNDNESERITQNMISYTINDVTVSASNTIGYKNDRVCTINKNIPSDSRTQLIEATLITTDLKDPKTGVSINGGEPLKASIELVLNISGTSAASLEVYANRLAFDKQNNGDITITANFRVGGKIQDTGVTYSWTRIPDKNSFNSTDKTVTVKRDDVDGLTTFTCTVSYADYDDFSDSVTINDYTDPIVSEIVSSNGTQFKSSDIQTDLTCRLFDSDSEVDPYVEGKAMEEYAYGYIWLKSANNTIASNPWRSIAYPCICKDTNGNYSIAKNETEASGKEKFVSGKKISITKTDIKSKATFYCEVIKL